MKKLIAIFLIALLSVAAVACTTTVTKTELTPVDGASAPAAETTETEKFVDLIPFVKDGEIYFDINVSDAIKNFGVQVDGKAISAETKAVPFNAESKLVFSGDADAEKSIDAYIVFGQKEDGHYRFEQSIIRGMDADAAAERLDNAVSRVLAGNAKIYVAIVDRGAGWDRNLSEKLNAFLDKYNVK